MLSYMKSYVNVMCEKGLISIIVVNWNRKRLLKSCLDSLQKQTYQNLEIIVVDNASDDGSVELIKNSFPQVKLIANRTNFLYSPAQNQGIFHSKGEFVLCLNNDAVLERSFLQEALTAMSIDAKIGIVSGKVLSMSGKYIDTAGQCQAPSRKPLERGHKQKDYGQFEKPGFIFGAGGVCPLYRREMLEEIKLKDGEYFDNDYGLFYEDLDLNWRANLFGWRAVYAPKAICFHARGGSVKLTRPKVSILGEFDFFYLLPEHKLLLLRNRYATIIKNDSFSSFWRDFFFIFLYDFSVWIYLFLFEPAVVIKFFRNTTFIKTAFGKRRFILAKIRRQDGKNNSGPILYFL